MRLSFPSLHDLFHTDSYCIQIITQIGLSIFQVALLIILPKIVARDRKPASHTMAVSIAGVISIVVFYLVILVIGLIAARKSGFRARNIDSQDVILAGRNIGLFVGVFTMTGRYNFPLLSLIFG